MIDLRSFESLGGANHGWLDAKHHFSFVSYHDANRVNWGNLRVWNDDTIQPNSGFPAHPQQDMEIITYVRPGAITHSLIQYGRRGDEDIPDLDRTDPQRLTAGLGRQPSLHPDHGGAASPRRRSSR